jgi:hypothetical protein
MAAYFLNTRGTYMGIDFCGSAAFVTYALYPHNNLRKRGILIS